MWPGLPSWQQETDADIFEAIQKAVRRGDCGAARIATPDTVTITQELVTQRLGDVFPGVADTRIERWVPAHADLTWANVMGPEFCIIDWEDWGMAPRGLDAATLWGNALAVPALADRVRQERRADLASRDGKLMALFFLSKIAGPHAYEEEAERLVAELQL